jgi:transposase-like protein
MFVLNEPAFRCEEAAYDYVEKRIWPDGPVCPHCGGRDRIGRLRGESTKVGTYKCYSCRKPFNVKIGTMLESTHVPLHMWLQALFLLHTCKPGISIHRLHRILGVSSRTTWLMAQRVRATLAENLAENPSEDETEEAFEALSPPAREGREVRHHALSAPLDVKRGSTTGPAHVSASVHMRG